MPSLSHPRCRSKTAGNTAASYPRHARVFPPANPSITELNRLGHVLCARKVSPVSQPLGICITLSSSAFPLQLPFDVVTRPRNGHRPSEQTKQDNLLRKGPTTPEPSTRGFFICCLPLSASPRFHLSSRPAAPLIGLFFACHNQGLVETLRVPQYLGRYSCPNPRSRTPQLCLFFIQFMLLSLITILYGLIYDRRGPKRSTSATQPPLFAATE